MHKLYKVRVEVELFWYDDKPPASDDYNLAEAVSEELTNGNGSRTYKEVTLADSLSDFELRSVPCGKWNPCSVREILQNNEPKTAT